MHRLEVRTNTREQMVDITAQVNAVIADVGASEGVAVVYCPHTTAGITTNENADPDVVRDLLEGLRRLAPCDGGWRHCEGNSDAHIKAAIVGSSATIPIQQGRLALGTWQAVYFCEFDGPRTRSATVTVIADAREA